MRRDCSSGENSKSGSHLASESLPPPLQFIFFSCLVVFTIPSGWVFTANSSFLAKILFL